MGKREKRRISSQLTRLSLHLTCSMGISTAKTFR
ncbi:MAG TPA: hypothetical protein PK820_07760 [Candidatus Competibacteraceae bacterium]|nr:hypothetical protein [Candidatus Competibacteraceae bacterium]